MMVSCALSVEGRLLHMAHVSAAGRPVLGAGHMTCTRPQAESQKSLDPWVPSTHDPEQKLSGSYWPPSIKPLIHPGKELGWQ